MPLRPRLLFSLAGLSAVLACASFSPTRPRTDAAPPRVPAPLPPTGRTAFEEAGRVSLPPSAPEELAALHNVFPLSDQIISGGEPHDEEGFRVLAEMGVRTILSVDGKVPDAERAAQYGMKYVHVPIQYKGITDEEVARIAKTFREQEGPFYVHCFHGKHRGPAAAAIGRIVRDGIPRDQAIAEMRQWCGTSEAYEGLYGTVAHGSIPEAAETAGMSWDFPAASPLEGIAGAMVRISRADDRLKSLSRSDWQPPEDHPDMDAWNEATQLASLLERALELEDVKAEPVDYRQWMQAAAQEAGMLRDALGALRQGSGSSAEAVAAYGALSKSCKTCHNAYRN